MKANKLFLLALGLVAVGCNDSQIEEQSLINDAQGEAVEVVLEGVVDNAVGSQARSVAEVTDQGAVRIKFDDTDAIGVYLNNEKVGLTHENVKFTVKSTEEDENGDVHATFTTEEPMILLGAGNNVYAYYPYEATETEFEGTSRSTDRGAWDGYHWFEVPYEQVQAGLGDYSNLAKYVHLYAPERQLAKQGNKVVVAAPGLQFRHAFAYFTLKLMNSYERSLKIANATVKAFNDGEPVALAGEFAVALDDTQMATEGLAMVVAGENVQNVVTVKAPTAEGLELAGETNSWIPVAVAADVTFDEVEVAVTTVDGYVYKQNLKVGSFKLKQNCSQPINFTLSDASLSPVVTNSEVAEYMLRMDKEEIVLDLAAHITLNINPTSDDAWGGPSTKTITFNDVDAIFDDHGRQVAARITFNMTEQTFNDVDVVNSDAVVTFNDVLINTTGYKSSGYTYHDLVFDCKVDMNRVMVANSMLVKRSANFIKTQFADSHNGSAQNYALWLQPTVEDQVVTIDGLVPTGSMFFNHLADIRGIKIDAETANGIENYVPTNVVLNLKNVWFHSTVKKAAVLVRPALDRNITATVNIGENVNISGVAQDKENHVWIDCDGVGKYNAENYDYFVCGENVEVTNGNWKFEGASWSAVADAQGNDTGVADDQTGLEHALAYGLNTIALKDNAYTLPDVPSTDGVRDITLSGSTDAVISNASGSYPAFGENTLTLKGVTLWGAGHATGVYAACLTLDDVKVDRALALRSDKAVIKNSKLNIIKDQFVRVYSAEAEITGNQFFTQGSAILIEPTKMTMSDKVIVTNNEFYASDVTTSNNTGVGKGQNRAAVEIDNTTCKEGEVLVLTTSGNTIPEGMSGVWRIFNNVADGATIQANGVYYLAAQDKWYLDGKEVIKLEDGSIILKSVTAE